MKKLFTPFLLLAAVIAFTANFASAQNAVNDGGFEGGIGAGTWTETSTNFGTPLCDAACGTCGGPCAANSGSIYAWFGGFGGGVEVGTLTQSVVVPTSASATELRFFFFYPTASPADADVFYAIVNTDTVFTATPADSTTYGAGYLEVTVNAEAYEGTTVNLQFYGETQGTSVSNFLLDDISLGTQSVDIEAAFYEHVGVFPTPATDELNIDLTLASKQDVTLSLTDMTGKVVFTQELGNIQNGKLAVDVREFAAGTYFLQVLKKDGALNTKVTIQ
jgi:Secretion system C-terminal sorting domain